MPEGQVAAASPLTGGRQAVVAQRLSRCACNKYLPPTFYEAFVVPHRCGPPALQCERQSRTGNNRCHDRCPECREQDCASSTVIGPVEGHG